MVYVNIWNDMRLNKLVKYLGSGTWQILAKVGECVVVYYLTTTITLPFRLVNTKVTFFLIERVALLFVRVRATICQVSPPDYTLTQGSQKKVSDICHTHRVSCGQHYKTGNNSSKPTQRTSDHIHMCNK